jgi:hypothetical protein
MSWYDFLSGASQQTGGQAANPGSPVTGGAPASFSVNGITNGLGITTPPPPNLATMDNPAYKNLLDAAGTMNANYAQTTAGRQVGQGYAEHGMNQEQQTIDQLRQAASGAPTAATNLMRAQTDQNARNAMNLAASVQGTNPGSALRAGLSSAQQTQIGSTAGAAAMAAQEQEAARQTLASATAQNQNAGNQIYSTAGQIEGTAGSNYNSANQAPFSAQMGQQQIQTQANAANQAAMGQLYGAIGKGIAASDPQLKMDVHDGTKMSDEFLDSISNPKTFEYKDPGAPGQQPGKRLGPMATDLPTHDVTTGPDGKKWISASAISDILGGLGRLHQRVSSMEAARSFA